MTSRTSRNVLAAILMVVGLLAIAAAPISAAEHNECGSFSVDFDDHAPGPLTKNRTSVGPVPINLVAGTYDITLVSNDPTHEAGKHTDQMHESWYFVLDNGFTSAVTPDFADDVMGTSITQTGITLGSASQVTAFWAGELPSWDSVHAAISFSCAPAPTTTVAPTTTAPLTPTTVPETTVPPTTTVSPTSGVPTSAVSPTSGVPATTAAPTSTTIRGEVLPSSSVAPATTAPPTLTSTPEGEIGGITEENPELARTGTNLNLALGGLAMIATGFALVASGAANDRRRATVRVR